MLQRVAIQFLRLPWSTLLICSLFSCVMEGQMVVSIAFSRFSAAQVRRRLQLYTALLRELISVEFLSKRGPMQSKRTGGGRTFVVVSLHCTQQHRPF